MIYQIAIYMRLSQDDGDFEAESNSIVNQRQLLRSYIAEHFEKYGLLDTPSEGRLRIYGGCK